MSEQTKLPYLNNPKKTESYFNRIKEVEVPSPKLTYDFLENVFLFKSHADRTLVSLLKKMGFLDQDGKPTTLYSDYRNDVESKKVIAKGIRQAFNELFRRNVKMDTLAEEQIKGYVKSVTGLGEESSTLPLITKTLTNLIPLGDFSASLDTSLVENVHKEKKPPTKKVDLDMSGTPLDLNYTISINLPETTNEEVYEKIFNSIKKTLMTK